MSARVRPATGFTLIELTVVMLLIAIVFSVTAPRLAGRTQAAKLRAAGYDVQALASSARARAVFGGRTVTLRIDEAGSAISMVALDEVADDEDEAQAKPLVPGRRLPVGVRAAFQPAGDGEPNQLAFRADGSAGSGELSLQMDGGEPLVLELSESLGRLRTMGAS